MKFLQVQTVDGNLKMAKIVKGADHFGAEIPEKTAFALLDRYFELGGNTIDTARIYGAGPDGSCRSEGVVGRWIRARGCRGQVVLVTKGAHPDRSAMQVSRLNRQTVEQELCTSMEQLGVEQVDLYFLHRDNPEIPVGEIVDLMDEQVKAGRVRALGASNWTTARLAQANAYARANGKAPFSISQIQWGLAYTSPALWGDPTLVCMNRQEYAGYLESKLPVMGFAPQGGGYYSKMIAGKPLREKIARRYDNPVNRARMEKLRKICARTGQTPAAVCVAFLTSSPVESAAIVGCSSVAQLEDSMSACDQTLSAADYTALLTCGEGCAKR